MFTACSGNQVDAEVRGVSRGSKPDAGAFWEGRLGAFREGEGRLGKKHEAWLAEAVTDGLAGIGSQRSYPAAI